MMHAGSASSKENHNGGERHQTACIMSDTEVAEVGISKR